MLPILVVVGAAAVQARPGESRRYFHSWLVVCSEDGSCGANAYVLGGQDDVGYEFKLTISRASGRAPYRLTLVPTEDPPAVDSPLGVRVDREAPLLLEAATGPGSSGVRAIRDEEVVAALVPRMKRGAVIVLAYRTSAGNPVKARFSLVGFTAALDFVDRVQGVEAGDPPQRHEAAASEPAEPAGTAQAPPRAGPSDREASDWTSWLLALRPSIDACLAGAPGVTKRVTGVSPRLDGTVDVRLRSDLGSLWRCVASGDGSRIESLERLPRSASLSGEGRVVYSPPEAGTPTGDCLVHERLSSPDGSALGWLSREEC